MTAKASCVGYPGRQRSVPICRIVVDMTGKAAATPVSHRVELVFCLLLAEVAACAEFPKHRIGGAMLQRLQIHGVICAGVAIDEPSCDIYNAVPCMHQVTFHRVDPVSVAASTSAVGILKVTRESDQSDVGTVNRVSPFITCMTADAINGTERVGRAESRMFRRVTLNARVARNAAIVGAKHKIRPGEYAQRDEPGAGSRQHGLSVRLTNYCTTGLLTAHST